MPLDTPFSSTLAPNEERANRGYRAHRAGLAAEAKVAAQYQVMGYTLAAERWRGAAGEIDLIFENAEGIVFVEVKKAKSVDIASARVSARQLQRLVLAGEEYLGTRPHGLLTAARFDLAAVGGLGDVSIVENITL
ncbi:MAG: YraN family protein [Pseudomonadota bacterium]